MAGKPGHDAGNAATAGVPALAHGDGAGGGAPLRNVQIEVRDFTSAIALVREGAGMALEPESTLPDNRRGLRIGELSPRLERVFGLVAAPNREPSRAAQAFIDAMRTSTPRRGRGGSGRDRAP